MSQPSEERPVTTIDWMERTKARFDYDRDLMEAIAEFAADSYREGQEASANTGRHRAQALETALALLLSYYRPVAAEEPPDRRIPALDMVPVSDLRQARAALAAAEARPTNTERLKQQALVISHLLAEAGITGGTLPEGVRQLWIRQTNAQGQIDYMCQEIAAILGLPVGSPADTVGAVRDLMAGAERWKAAAEAPPQQAEHEHAALAKIARMVCWRTVLMGGVRPWTPADGLPNAPDCQCDSCTARKALAGEPFLDRGAAEKEQP